MTPSPIHYDSVSVGKRYPVAARIKKFPHFPFQLHNTVGNLIFRKVSCKKALHLLKKLFQLVCVTFNGIRKQNTIS